jgi:hypothetical protein
MLNPPRPHLLQNPLVPLGTVIGRHRERCRVRRILRHHHAKVVALNLAVSRARAPIENPAILKVDVPGESLTVLARRLPPHAKRKPRGRRHVPLITPVNEYPPRQRLLTPRPTQANRPQHPRRRLRPQQHRPAPRLNRRLLAQHAFKHRPRNMRLGQRPEKAVPPLRRVHPVTPAVLLLHPLPRVAEHPLQRRERTEVVVGQPTCRPFRAAYSAAAIPTGPHNAPPTAGRPNPSYRITSPRLPNKNGTDSSVPPPSTTHSA